jgi:hypothetical protein
VRTQVRASLAIADELVAEATQILATQADTWRPGSETAERHLSLNPFSAHYPVPMVVLNPLAWTVRAPVVFPHAAGAAYDEQGLPVPIQSVASREGTRYPTHTLTILDVPPLGHRVCWLLPPGDGEPGRQGPPARTTDGAAATPGRTVSAAMTEKKKPGRSPAVRSPSGARCARQCVWPSASATR